MSETKLVRASRDGDQFHYLWAARRCLRLLAPSSDLTAITIEGASHQEIDGKSAVEEGDEKIDIAEYYASETLEHATLVRYMQLKHSTLRASEHWTPSELGETLKAFAARYIALRQHSGLNSIPALEFWLVSNRKVGARFAEAIRDATNSAPPRHPAELAKLETFTSSKGTELSSFCGLVRIDDRQDGYWNQRNILAKEASGYLADSDSEAPLQLKELVTRKATSEFESNPTITKMDVLRALNTDESRLFPAPCLIRAIENAVPREQESDLIGQITNAQGRPVVVHAGAGVGKSVFSTRIGSRLPARSLCIVYDCFGDGQYRSPTAYRHRHKDALVQISNELASLGLCHPLIPTPHADSSDYLRTFLFRLRQAAASLEAQNPGAVLCIAIDAADNAQIAADEAGEPRSFALDLLREQMPAGIRLVLLCRTHRQELLNPPPNVLPLELLPFSRQETAAYLRRTFPDATEQDVNEFHWLSSQNPRVQALALSRKDPLEEVLRRLGPNPTSADDAIADLLNQSLANIRDAGISNERAHVDRLCQALAALRPLVPISVLAAVSGVSAPGIKSFATNLGRSLLVTGNTVQFLDEPTETWFREQFKANATALAGFIEVLKPLALTSAYVASALPQLLLEAGRYEELAGLALSSDALPESSPLERREIELQRLQFALKATLRKKQYASAAKLALKAGGETAGNARREALLQANTDLASEFIDAGGVQEIVSRRTFGSGWFGSHLAYEAGLMSGKTELLAAAGSSLRMAEEWLRNWSRMPSDERQRECVADEDVAEMAMAQLNVNGIAACAESLRRWTPHSVSFHAGRRLARRLVDRCRYDDVDGLASAAGDNVYLLLAVAVELRKAQRNPPDGAVRQALRLLANPDFKLTIPRGFETDGLNLQAVTAVIEAGYTLSLSTRGDLATLLKRYLPDVPPRSAYSRHFALRSTFLRAYSLHAALADEPLDLVDLAHPELREKLEKRRDSQEVREFKEDIGGLLPWHRLWASVLLGRTAPDAVAAAVEDARVASANAKSSYEERSYTSNEVASVWFECLIQGGAADADSMAKLSGWIESLKLPLHIPTLTHLARVSARTESLRSQALAFAFQAFELTKDAREDAETKVSSYVDLSRAVLGCSRPEALEYFNQAVNVANKIGNENLARWTAMLDLADGAGSRETPKPMLAYKLARCAELTHQYDGTDSFPWEDTVRSIASLCPASSLAILSRWRDRDFGVPERLLPPTVTFLIDRGDLTSRDALPLIAFRAPWKEVRLLKGMLQECPAGDERQKATSFAYRYMTLRQPSAHTWRELRDVLAPSGLVPRGLDDLIAFSDRNGGPGHRQSGMCETGGLGLSQGPGERDWKSVFTGLDLGTADDVSRAYRRLKDFGPPYDHERFFQQACDRVKPGAEADFATALAGVADFGLYQLRSFLEHIPAAWKQRLSVKPAIARAVKSICRRYCLKITKDRRYEVLPLDLACETSGLAESELIDEVLSALGQHADPFDADRLFTLVGLLATRLSAADAMEALEFGLNLFEEALEEEDGDGPWTPALAPPLDLVNALAGYVWAGLAAPRGSLRWEAAHVVRGLCTLKREPILARLVEFAEGSTGGPFADARLHFYHLHARQWLLIALARAANESPEMLLPLVEFLMQFALGGEPHVLIKEFAASALLRLLDAGLLQGQSALRQQLSAVNTSPFPVIASRSLERIRNLSVDDDKGVDQSTLYFDMDMGPHWFNPLASCFGLTEKQVEREARRVITTEWSFLPKDGWIPDERERRRIFRDGETYDSRSYPSTHDLRFYLSYHAVMIVAGNLLATLPTHRDPDEPQEDFRTWLLNVGLARTDGHWLADRRDPVPLEWPSWKDETETRDWPWSLSGVDFERLLLSSTGRVNVWGDWSAHSGSREENVQIKSALVSRSRSEALLRALQTARARDYAIPLATDELEIDHGDFQLRGWIAERSYREGLDTSDPWAGKISYPPPEPAQFVIDLMRLQADFERRTWSASLAGQDPAAMWAEIWGQWREHRDEEEPENGNRLQASLGFIVDLLRRVDSDMIVKVQLERRNRYPHYERGDYGDLGYLPKSARLFLLKPDGSISSI